MERNEESRPSDNSLNAFGEDFKRGYVGGLENRDKSFYESYLASSVSLEDCQRQIHAKQVELGNLEKELLQHRTNAQQAFQTLQENTQGHALKLKQVERLNNRLSALTDEEVSLKERRNQTRAQHSLLAAVLYLAAGIVFMLGDLIISHEIVAYALNIRNNVEAWSFAVGLAALSVLLKPAYERLFELPYTKEGSEKNKKRYVWFKGFVVAFAVGTLFVLGWFRYEAYKVDKLKDNLNKTIRSLQMEDTPEALQKVDQQLQTINTLNLDLVNSPWAMASFILTGILFAIAGAVCLGIAFPVLQGYWQRWVQLDWTLNRMKRERKKVVQQIENLEGELALHQTQMHMQERFLAELPATDRLEEKQLSLIRDLEKLHENRKFAETDCRIAAFNDGYERGLLREKIGHLQGYAEDQHSELTTPLAGETSQAEKGNKKGTGERTRHATRPYLAIRKMITSQFENDQLS